MAQDDYYDRLSRAELVLRIIQLEGYIKEIARLLAETEATR